MDESIEKSTKLILRARDLLKNSLIEEGSSLFNKGVQIRKNNYFDNISKEKLVYWLSCEAELRNILIKFGMKENNKEHPLLDLSYRRKWVAEAIAIMNHLIDIGKFTGTNWDSSIDIFLKETIQTFGCRLLVNKGTIINKCRIFANYSSFNPPSG